MRSKEEILANLIDCGYKITDPEGLRLEVSLDIRDQLKRIADSLEGNKVHVSQKMGPTHLEKILDNRG